MTPRLQQLALRWCQGRFGLASTLACHNIEHINAKARHHSKPCGVGGGFTPLPLHQCIARDSTGFSEIDLSNA